MKLAVLFFSLFFLWFVPFAQKVTLSTVCFNTENDEFGLRMIGSKLYCVSASFDDLGIMIDPNTKKPYTDLYEVKDCKLIPATFDTKEFGAQTSMNSNFYDGPISGSSDILFFTNNHGLLSNDMLGIYYSKFMNGKWENALDFPYNSLKYNVSYPFYDKLGHKIYFSSDMQNKDGNLDLYFCDFDGVKFGAIQKIQNACSPKNEMAPYVFEGNLYFTSNGFNSIGGYDLFLYKEEQVSSMGNDFNTIYDELTLMFENDSVGYFATNRFSKGLQDEIVKFSIQKEKIQIIDTVVLLASNIEILKELISTKEELMLVIQEAKAIGVSKDIFSFIDKSLLKYGTNFPESFKDKSIDEIKLSIKELKGISLLLNQQIQLAKNQLALQVKPDDTNPVKEEITPKEDLEGSEMNNLIDQSTIENIQFEFNSSVLPANSKVLLNGLVLLLKANTNWLVTLSGHTDNKGSAEFNLFLSGNRAKAVRDYLIKSGIPTTRITTLSFGLSKPIASNDTPEGRFKNRRVEFDITNKK